MFGNASRAVPVSSIKPLIGETLGASGPLQLASACTALETGSLPALPPTETSLPDSPLTFVTGQPASATPGTVLVNTIDPGGSCVSYLVRKSG